MPGKKPNPQTFSDQLAAEKQRLQSQIAALPDGAERDALLKKIDKIETATKMNDWFKPPGSQTSK